MRIVSKKISYDDLVSKVPGVTPSIVDSWNIPLLYSCGNEIEETYYSYSSAVKRAREYNVSPSELIYDAKFINFDANNLKEFISGNYGLIPSDVIIPNEIAKDITDYTDIYVNLPIPDEKKSDNGYDTFYDLSWPKSPTDPHYEGRKIVSGETNTEIKVLTYYTLNKWYSFFKKYYELIEHPDYARTYSNAIDYYETEIDVKNDELEKYYEDLDLTFNSRGGKKMYEWICNNCIIQFNIPAEFADEWNTTRLYFADAIKWYWWFNERVEKYENVLYLDDCKKTDDCCDCSEYVKLGGEAFYNKLSAWIENHSDFDSNATNSASIVIPITFTTTIDDLGEMSIFSSKWQEEVDYHNTLPGVLSEKPGTVVNRPYKTDELTGEKTLLDDTYVINGSKKGYTYNDFHENVFKENDWVNYSDYYISNNPKEFETNGVVNGNTELITEYAFSPLNGKIIYNPTEIKEKIPFNKQHNVCINGVTYDVIDGKYVMMCYDTSSIANIKYKGNNLLPILKDGDLEYAVLNGKRKYVENDDGVEKIYFLKGYDCYDDGCEISKGSYVAIDDSVYLVEGNCINIDEDDSKYVYPILNGYFDIDNNRFYVYENKVVISNGSTYDEESNSYLFEFRELTDEELKAFGFESISVNDDYIEISYSFETHKCDVVSGYCESKLDLLRRKEISIDDLGNELPGYFTSIVDVDGDSNQSNYNNTYNECTLDILYKVGEVCSLTINEDLTGDNGQFFDGNIIDNIEFYYKDKYGEKLFATQANNDNAIYAIDTCRGRYEAFKDENSIDVMYCDITYYFGAVIKLNSSNKYVRDKNYHSGVKYIDTVKVTKNVGKYYMGDGKYFTFKYYSLGQDVSSIDLSDFKTFATSDYSTYFEMERYLYKHDTDYLRYVDGWSENNDLMAAPVFRSEFNIASSFPQNVDANIYIDRGINAAFEKHLKLQEIRTMEALETYSNGIFKINKY